MNMNLNLILSVDLLEIGYASGRNTNILLPPLNAGARKGELIAVIGKNGIGKSTLLRTLTGLQPVLGGVIRYSGKNLKDYSRNEIARKIGYISTEIVRVTNMSVYDLVALGRYPHTNWTGKIDSHDHQIIMDAIEKTSMSKLCHKFISQLSDGERQKAMIARILAQDTDIMIMDEPTAFLDIGSKYEILHLLHHLSQKNGKTIIFSTHDLHMAISQSDKIWLILDDQLEEGAPEDLMLKGVFDNLFESSSVRFNSDDGTFSFRGEERGSLYIDGDGILRHWTEEALSRSGFSVSKIKTNPYIKITNDSTNKWQYISDVSTEDFYSIYELAYFLVKKG